LTPNQGNGFGYIKRNVDSSERILRSVKHVVSFIITDKTNISNGELNLLMIYMAIKRTTYGSRNNNVISILFMGSHAKK
jgi:hypothetical protein